MFAELLQETEKSEECATNCVQTYTLKSRYFNWQFYSDYSLVGEDVIVTQMNRFYYKIDIRSCYGGRY